MSMSSSSFSSFDVSSSDYSSVSSSFTGIQNNADNLIPGVIGYYKIDTTRASQDRDTNWDFVEITWNAASQTFTWANLAGVSWTLTPISGSGGWDTTKLAVGNDNPYFTEGYTFATIEWVSSEGSNRGLHFCT